MSVIAKVSGEYFTRLDVSNQDFPCTFEYLHLDPGMGTLQGCWYSDLVRCAAQFEACVIPPGQEYDIVYSGPGKTAPWSWRSNATGSVYCMEFMGYTSVDGYCSVTARHP